jgi:hypothetical protein
VLVYGIVGVMAVAALVTWIAGSSSGAGLLVVLAMAVFVVSVKRRKQAQTIEPDNDDAR